MTLSKPSQTATYDLTALLQGSFELRRVIVSRDGTTYRLSGEATFSPAGNGEVLYIEHGELVSDHGTLQVSRTYRYSITDTSTAWVRFADGTLFHDLDLSRGKCRVTHLCGEDTYKGLIVVADADLLTRWTCSGPAKDYVATSRLIRRSRLPQS